MLLYNIYTLCLQYCYFDAESNKPLYIRLQVNHQGRPTGSKSKLDQAAALPSTLLAVPNVTGHPSTASVPIILLLYDGLLLCGFNLAIKGLILRVVIRK